MGQDPENLYVHFNDATGNFSIELFDLSGNTLYKNGVLVSPEHRESIGISHLAGGVYVLMIEKEGKRNTYKLRVR